MSNYTHTFKMFLYVSTHNRYLLMSFTYFILKDKSIAKIKIGWEHEKGVWVHEREEMLQKAQRRSKFKFSFSKFKFCLWLRCECSFLLLSLFSLFISTLYFFGAKNYHSATALLPKVANEFKRWGKKTTNTTISSVFKVQNTFLYK